MLENVKSNSVFQKENMEQKALFEGENKKNIEQNVPLTIEAGATSKIKTPEKEVFG
ncbi:MAG TPA: hypothetical protein VHT34_01060 [Clostridia bacterium]|nr:hypothetical protein [Clostridia bacterium]